MSRLDDERIGDLIADLEEAIASGEDTIRVIEAYSLADRALGLIALFNRGDYEKMPALLPPDHVHDMRPVGIPDMGVYRGREEYAKFIRAWIEAFPHAHLEPEFEVEMTEPIEAGFGVVKQEIRGSASDVPIAFRYVWIGEYSDERRETIFGTDFDQMRELFRTRYGLDPGPVELQPLSPSARQEA